MERESVQIKDRMCLHRGCPVRLRLGQLYCDLHRPGNFQVTGPDGTFIAWKDHPDFEFRRNASRLKLVEAAGDRPPPLTATSSGAV